MLLKLCFFLSGAAALVLQVLWTRMLGHVFGASALAVSSTLTAFMGGLALGAHLGGKVAPRLARPVLVFSILEIAVGLYGFLVPGLLSLMPAVQRLIGLDLSIGFIGYSVLRFLLVAVILLLPTTAMGATLPILAQAAVKDRHRLAKEVGSLYAANTFGAVAGAMAAGFFLIPRFGISKTVYIAAAMDLFVALTVLLAFWLAKSDALLLKPARGRSPDEMLLELEPVLVEDVSPFAGRITLWAFALSGAAAMSMEVLWTRAVSVIIGASTYAFTLILSTFLVGLSVGAAVTTRYVERIKNPVRWLAWIEVGVAGLALLGSLFVDRLPGWLWEAARQHGVNMRSLYFTNFLIASTVMLPATVLLGAVMPLVVRILSPRGEPAGALVGRAYTLNTIGAIVGSFSGGFILLPLFGVQRGLFVAIGATLLVAVVLAISRRPRDLWSLAAAASVGVAMFLAPAWNVGSWTAGLFRYYLSRHVYTDQWDQEVILAYHKDGIACTVTVETDEPRQSFSLKVNGKVDASDEGDMPTQVLSGLLPLLFTKDAKDVLVIGYGSGVTSGAALVAPIERLVLVEIEEAVYEAANRFFGHVNRRPPEDPRFSAVIDDGRNFLLTRNESFDVIISEPSNPWMSGASSLFTEDFFRIVHQRLRPNGVFLQWLQLYELSAENIRILVRTLHAVFPEVVIFTPNPRSNDTLLIAADFPLRLSKERIDQFFADEKLKAELLRAKVIEPEDFVGLFLLGSKDLPRFLEDGPKNTDDSALIEFSAPQDLLQYATGDAELPVLEATEGRRIELVGEHLLGFDLADPKVLLRTAYRLLRQGRLADVRSFLTGAQVAIDLLSEGSEKRALQTRRAELAMLLEKLSEAEGEAIVVISPETQADPKFAEAVAQMLGGHERDALRLVDSEKSFELRSLGHRLLYAYLAYRKDRTWDAEWLIEGVLSDRAFSVQNPSVYYYAARIHADQGDYGKAIDHLETYVRVSTSSAAVPNAAWSGVNEAE